MIQAPWLTESITNKFKSDGQNPDVYLEGLMHSKYLSYWDYVQLDTLLTLQKTKTDFPDEEIFIMYHQVNELLFKMILLEIRNLAECDSITKEFIIKHVGRITRYFKALITSFDIMRDGMDYDQYLKFRTSLTPASGFQSVQYRMIEIGCTDLHQLVDFRNAKSMPLSAPIEQMLDNLYWQAAGKDPATGNKSLTLSMFEEKYKDALLQFAIKHQHKNIRALYRRLPDNERKDEKLISSLKELDRFANIEWPLVHYRTAERYLESNGSVKEATGGSHWKKYLHPKYQKRIFFPELWTKEELDNWAC